VATVKKYNLTGQEEGDLQIDDALLTSDANPQMIKDYLVALRTNLRQWSAHTKGRSEVNHSGQKPHPQKGTGRARQGFLGAPQYKGGGRVFGPRTKQDQHVRINKKERRAAIRQLLVEKIRDNRLHVISYEGLKAPQTKKVAGFLQARGLENKRVLILGDDADKKKKSSDHFIKSLRNIQKLEYILFPNASGYDLAVPQAIFVVEPAFEQLLTMLKAR
jgi:large subunit ribosomal protein L4